jgi:hydroxyethylthiazole kinase-like uncharacterized protein yjeF
LVVTLTGERSSLPPDAARALSDALAAGVMLSDAPPEQCDLAIDALLGIGARESPQGLISEHLLRMHAISCPVLAVDVPSGLMADTGVYNGPASHSSLVSRHTLALLTLKPGLFTADGRDLAGTVWFEPLRGAASTMHPPQAILYGQTAAISPRAHTAHKGSQGDVVVIGGQDMADTGVGMTGAAVMAARAALTGGAGRVYLGLLDKLDDHTTRWDPTCPELMVRRVQRLVEDTVLMQAATVVCGCGGGSAVAPILPSVLSTAHRLVLDADALNRIAEDQNLKALLRVRRSRGLDTVITPHPLEAARLLGCSAREVMVNRLAAANSLCESLGVICVLKGSGTVVAAPGEWPRINSSGNPALATAGTGDVLAGWIGASLASLVTQRDATPLTKVLEAVFKHGHLADQWVARQTRTLTANRLAMEFPGC